MTVLEIYAGSDGDATKGLYRELCELGIAGEVAMNLFRAQKASARAKVYRGGLRGQGSFRKMAYDRKQRAMSNLATILVQHAATLGIRWGWQQDPATDGFPWVLYVDIPDIGHVSFHTASRGPGPDYPYEWDRAVGASPGRIVRWCEQLLQPAEVRG